MLEFDFTLLIRTKPGQLHSKLAASPEDHRSFLPTRRTSHILLSWRKCTRANFWNSLWQNRSYIEHLICFHMLPHQEQQPKGIQQALPKIEKWRDIAWFYLPAHIFVIRSYSRWTKKSKPTNPRAQISMLHKALYSFLCVRVWLFCPPAPSAQPRGNIEIWGCGGDNKTAGVWFHRPSMVGIHECLFCWLCYFWFWLLPLSGSSPQNPKDTKTLSSPRPVL